MNYVKWFFPLYRTVIEENFFLPCFVKTHLPIPTFTYNSICRYGQWEYIFFLYFHFHKAKGIVLTASTKPYVKTRAICIDM